MPRSSSGLGHELFKLATGVRFSVGVPDFYFKVVLLDVTLCEVV